jgi:hypothetical protein
VTETILSATGTEGFVLQNVGNTPSYNPIFESNVKQYFEFGS